jgi:hypothetical protein
VVDARTGGAQAIRYGDDRAPDTHPT